MNDTSSGLDGASQLAEGLTLRVRDLEASANSFSRAMTSAFAVSVTGGKQFDDVLKDKSNAQRCSGGARCRAYA